MSASVSVITVAPTVTATARWFANPYLRKVGYVSKVCDAQIEPRSSAAAVL